MDQQIPEIGKTYKWKKLITHPLYDGILLLLSWTKTTNFTYQFKFGYRSVVIMVEYKSFGQFNEFLIRRTKYI